MARIVHCRRYGEDLEGLERPPLPGSKGQDIFDNVSKKAWLEWQRMFAWAVVGTKPMI